jgi:hypothetical protein
MATKKPAKTSNIMSFCPRCSGTMEEHAADCPTRLKLPVHAAENSIEAMAVIYKRALTVSVAAPDMARPLRRQVDEILNTCRHYLPPQRVRMMDLEQQTALQGEGG